MAMTQLRVLVDDVFAGKVSKDFDTTLKSKASKGTTSDCP